MKETVLALAMIFVAAFAYPVSSSAAPSPNCPENVRETITQTLRASDIHAEILVGTYDYKMTQPNEDEWHEHWRVIHKDAAVLLTQAYIACLMRATV